MKRYALLFFSLLLINISAMSQKNPTNKWTELDSLIDIGQVKTAEQAIEKIYLQSKQDNNFPELLKSIEYKMKAWDDYAENSTIKSIELIENELKTAVAPSKQVLHAFLANVYYSHYQRNRWQIEDRLPLDGESSDIETWSTKRFFEEIESNIALSLSQSEILQKTSVQEYECLMKGDKSTRLYRPTLFDILSYNALKFYTNPTEQTMSKSFYFNIDSEDYFLPAKQFAKISINQSDTNSFRYKSLVIYQNMIKFHLTDKQDFLAIITSDLNRLSYVYGNCTMHDSKDFLYENALRNLAKEYPHSEGYTEIIYHLAEHLNNMGENYYTARDEKYRWLKKEAHTLCTDAVERYPKSYGAQLCKKLIISIETKECSVTTKSVNLPNKPFLASVKYKNADKVFLRLVKIKEKDVADIKVNYGQFDKINLSKYEVTKHWSIDLPNDGDYLTNTTEVIFPELEAGYYLLQLSENDKFDFERLYRDKLLCVSEISYVVKNNNNGEDYIVINRNTGKPIDDFVVKKYAVSRDYRRSDTERTKIKEKQYKNAEGKFRIDADKSGDRYFLSIGVGNDVLFSEYRHNYPSWSKSEPRKRIYFYTDRAIYRPGQTVYYKGIVVNDDNKNFSLEENYKSEFRVFDANGQEVYKTLFTTNEYGSFSGSFNLPTSGLTGRFTVSGKDLYHSIRVEEYKRPKFFVDFAPVSEEYVLNQEVKVSGTATSYSGTSVSDAKVNYRVERSVLFYRSYFYYSIPFKYENVEILNGSTTTNDKGEFVIAFDAVADRKIEKKYMPYYNFTVYADVVDINGETHSFQKSVVVGYNSLLISTDISDKFDAKNGFSFKVSAENFGGQEQTASGTVVLQKLREPDVALYKKDWEKPNKFVIDENEFKKLFKNEIYNDEDDYTKWSVEEEILNTKFTTPDNNKFEVGKTLKTGFYVVEINSKDAFGNPVNYKKYFTVFDSRNSKGLRSENLLFEANKRIAQPDDVIDFTIGVPFDNTTIFVEATNVDGIIFQKQFKLSNKQTNFSIPITEAERGNVKINAFYLRDNHYLSKNIDIIVGYDNKKLEIAQQTLRSKLTPGAEEEWTFTIKNNKNLPEVAEVLASMYDASLDAIYPNGWSMYIPYKTNYNSCYSGDVNYRNLFSAVDFKRKYEFLDTDINYEYLFETGYYGNEIFYLRSMAGDGARTKLKSAQEEYVTMDYAVPGNAFEEVYREESAKEAIAPAPENADTDEKEPEVNYRKDLSETAFFYPHLLSNKDGEFVVKFTLPESLTEWKLLAIAHNAELKHGTFTQNFVSQKDLMVFPNMPRFFRQGDKISISAKITNNTSEDIEVETYLQLFDAISMNPIDYAFNNTDNVKNVSIKANNSAQAYWNINIPNNANAVIYRIIAKNKNISDGEEGFMPILPNRMMVTESFPIEISRNADTTVSLDRITLSDQDGIQTENIIVEFTENPIWYAIQALPYVTNNDSKLTDVIFNRFYVNTLASYIANSNEKIRHTFETWQKLTPETFLSNLEKNQELKSVVLNETPWVMDAISEKEQKLNIGQLFNLNNIKYRQDRDIQLLIDAQNYDGGWSWFPGSKSSVYITQSIVAGFGKLIKNNIIDSKTLNKIKPNIDKAINFIDKKAVETFDDIKKYDKDYKTNRHLHSGIIHYLYTRSFFANPYSKDLQDAISYYEEQTNKYWTNYSNYLKGAMAIYMKGNKNYNTSELIMHSLKETSLYKPELGMYWKEPNTPYWYQLPIETTTMMIETFSTVSNDQTSVERLKVNLLKNKQTNRWKTNSSTANAIYALTAYGDNIINEDKPVSIILNGKEINPRITGDNTKQEAGSGYFKKSFKADYFDKSDAVELKINNPNSCISWGATYWQYYQDLDKITEGNTDNPFNIEMQLYKIETSESGRQLIEIDNTNLEVGDKVVVRMVIETDRNLEYVHIKNMRAATFEPVSNLSGYRYKNGIGYYEAVKDVSTEFFIEYMPKGKYVFEYELFATQKGSFSNGITVAECYYAPEFGSHSAGCRVTVK